ncbi:DUF2621 family protein [Kurthia sibirica]|nr:DUF2621 family protein [Kurthia sibirica]GEK34612.1 hypothetical protein KSI01_21450 [Kurthia sibirica]
MSGLFMWFIVGWCVLFIVLMAIGGFFMFRKFLKALPKKDGKSILDWQDHYINQSLHLWDERAKNLLNELVSPVPELFRDVAKAKIAGVISRIVLEEQATTVEFEHIIRGYIEATPPRDHKFLRKKLYQMDIDVAQYEHYFLLEV